MAPSVARIVLLLFLVISALGCAEKASVDSGDGKVEGQTSKSGALLAYEHGVEYAVPPSSIRSRVEAVRAACDADRFGACSVLSIEVGAGRFPSGAITVRVAPEGVAGLVGLGGNEGEVERRTLVGEDLADAVAAAEDRTALLQRQRTTLVELLERDDVTAANIIAISGQIAQIDGELQSLSQTRADQRRRIETNKLTLTFRSDAAGEDAGFSFATAWGDFGDSLAEGTYATIEYAGYFLPLALLVFPFALLWRWAWRKATRRGPVV